MPTSVVSQRTPQGRAEQLRFLELRSVSGARDELQLRAGYQVMKVSPPLQRRDCIRNAPYQRYGYLQSGIRSWIIADLPAAIFDDFWQHCPRAAEAPRSSNGRW
jgi:hypothetical protein